MPQGSHEARPEEGQVQDARAAFQFGPRAARADFFFLEEREGERREKERGEREERGERRGEEREERW